MRSLKERVRAEVFSCNCNVGDRFSDDFEKNGIFLKLQTMSFSTACKGRMRVHCSVSGSALIAAASGKLQEKRKRVWCSTQKERMRGDKKPAAPFC